MYDLKQTIILDIGSRNLKVGFSGESKPKSVFPSLAGSPKYCCSHDHKIHRFYGYMAIHYCGVLVLNEIIHRGIINHWESLNILLDFTFEKELQEPFEEHPIIFTETSFNLKLCREKLLELMFEEKEIPLFYIKNEAALSLLASGNKTGVVIEGGNRSTCIVPIYDGHPIQDAINKINIGGSDIVNNFLKSANLANRSGSYKFISDFFECYDVKEKYFYVAKDYEEELKNMSLTKETVHAFDEYKKYSFLDRQRFMCPEILFNPKMSDLDFEGLPKEIVKSILKCDVKIQNELFSNIIISGGNSLLNGFTERIKNELNLLTENMNIKINVVAQDGRENFSWIGGSILSSEDNFTDVAISPSEYMEVGHNIVNIKCKQY